MHMLLTVLPLGQNYRPSSPPCNGPLNLSPFLFFKYSQPFALSSLSIFSFLSLSTPFPSFLLLAHTDTHTHARRHTRTHINTHPFHPFAFARCPYLSPFSLHDSPPPLPFSPLPLSLPPPPPSPILLKQSVCSATLTHTHRRTHTKTGALPPLGVVLNSLTEARSVCIFVCLRVCVCARVLMRTGHGGWGLACFCTSVLLTPHMIPIKGWRE